MDQDDIDALLSALKSAIMAAVSAVFLFRRKRSQPKKSGSIDGIKGGK